jgi:penicillin-binding protein 1B
MSIYQRYLASESPIALDLTPPEDIVSMGVDENGNFICGGGGMRMLPVWTTNPDALCQQSQQQIEQQQSANPFDNSSSQPPQQQQQQQQQPAQEKKDGDGVAGWIKDMFGGN